MSSNFHTAALPNFPHLTLVIGGARSGKSRLAEGLARQSGLLRTYIATAQAWDAEMAQRISAHQKDRGADWHTVEAPTDLPAALASAPKGVVLIDCATLWLTNLMLSEADIACQSDDLMSALNAYPGPVIIVTNEVGMSIVPENALARRFRDDQGRLNQRLAVQADLVVLAVAGLPLVIKGQMPQVRP